MKRGLAAACMVLIPGAWLAGCGQVPVSTSSTKIVGGEEVPDGQQDARRWSTVALTTDLARGDSGPLLAGGHSFCSGTIIHERAILTAAHCIQAFDPETQETLPETILPTANDFIVYFGTQVEEGGTWIRASHVVPHPSWSPADTLSPQPSGPPNDIGIVILSEPIPETYQVAPVAESTENLQDQPAHLAGYGVTISRNQNDTGTLRQVDVAYKTIDADSQRVGVGEFFRGACAGDSGGPAYVTIDGNMKLVGVTSTGAEIFSMCIGLINNYTDARYYATWIENTLLSNNLSVN